MGRILTSAPLCALLLAMAGPAAGQAEQPPSQDPERLDFAPDRLERMTVAVTVGGRGPFRFVVDTGAERTVVSRQLAEALHLASSDTVRLASIVDVRRVPTVMIPQLLFGRRMVEAIQAPVLEAGNLGAHGMLGVDTLEDQQLVLDFGRREMRLTRSRPSDDHLGGGTIVVGAHTLLGRMVLTDASVDGKRVTVIVDTGSPISIGNVALRDRLINESEGEVARMLRLTSVTGGFIDVGYRMTRRVMIGEAGIRDLPIAFANLQLFRELGLEDRPAMIIGMDVLQLFRRVSIDFARRRLRLTPPPEATSAPNLGMSVVR